jgi:hypothetical protein
LCSNGEVVLAMFENEWYRAHVLDAHPAGVILQFIDYGNVDIVKTDKMMQNPLDLKFDICVRDFNVDSES